MREFVEVSSEMTLLLGAGALDDAPLPPEAIVLSFDADGETPTLSFDLNPNFDELSGAGLALVVQHTAFERIGGENPEETSFHLPSALRSIVGAILDSTLSGEALKVYRIGKALELLCETVRLQGAGELFSIGGDGALSIDDTRRIVAARRLIDERWHEKLTLNRIARACGLNRAKLTRGFRDMFNCTIAEAIAERRLSQASHMLRTTDLPVSSIGYENGYLNNASFARAFSRRFGQSPSTFRAGQVSMA